jgi:hypothetical protein
MSDNTQDAFETAMADVFEGREVQFGEGPRRMLRDFYDRAKADAGGSTASSRAKIGQSVANFSDLNVGDVFQNDHLVGEGRCRRVTRIINTDTIETEYVSTRSKRIVKTESYARGTFESYWNYKYIADPA